MSDSEKNRYAKYNKYGDSDFSWQKKCTNLHKLVVYYYGYN